MSTTHHLHLLFQLHPPGREQQTALILAFAKPDLTITIDVIAFEEHSEASSDAKFTPASYHRMTN